MDIQPSQAVEHIVRAIVANRISGRSLPQPRQTWTVGALRLNDTSHKRLGEIQQCVRSSSSSSSVASSSSSPPRTAVTVRIWANVAWPFAPDDLETHRLSRRIQDACGDTGDDLGERIMAFVMAAECRDFDEAQVPAHAAEQIRQLFAEGHVLTAFLVKIENRGDPLNLRRLVISRVREVVLAEVWQVEAGPGPLRPPAMDVLLRVVVSYLYRSPIFLLSDEDRHIRVELVPGLVSADFDADMSATWCPAGYRVVARTRSLSALHSATPSTSVMVTTRVPAAASTPPPPLPPPAPSIPWQPGYSGWHGQHWLANKSERQLHSKALDDALDKLAALPTPSSASSYLPLKSEG